ncbi:MAG: class I SAM-dependent methyltransferase, partial [Phycisphaeraceae bacterium]|nr:class I SAM-dependent methyltransferase [Phycisphaeraceae bacterium]
MSYDALASIWPLISPLADERPHAKRVDQRLRAALGPGEHTLLELGSGCGHATCHLQEMGWRVTAVDLSEPMLERSRTLNPGVQHHRADVRTLALDQRFDAVALHDVAEHLVSEDDVRQALAVARDHLRPGGVVLVNLIETSDRPEAATDAHAEADREALTIS